MSQIQIPSTMKGAYLPGSSQVELRTVPVPQPGPGQVLLQTRASALCGSDLRLIYRPKTHKSGPDGYRGVIAGHEPCGIIVKRGEGVSDAWKEGTRVVVYHIQGCGDCYLCRLGQYISCESPSRRAYGWQRDGGHGEYLLADTQSLVRLLPPLTYLDGALIACGFGTAYAACTRANISGRDRRVLVTGMGPVGLAVALLAQRMGAVRVLGVEPDSERVKFARSLGVECVQTLTASPTASGQDASAKDASLEDAEDLSYEPPAGWTTEGDGGDARPEVCIDCSGNARARLHCLKMAGIWGRVVFVGEGGRVGFDVSELVIHKNLTILGSWVCSVAQMEELTERLVAWDLHPEITVTNTFRIDEAEIAYSTFNSGKTGKCTILYGDEKQVYKR
ncbi:oxidoreductase [Schizopora paradoxa]|uniref:Oxidoreductase n=1 Tax=Schizopora paradoxa TaxID=27342 RepID=A0A0H2SFG5_9AGAM|nr:oxidoreductase [Schizopora paradoxa]